MIFKTILTSKGTTTIPIEIRKQLGIKPGMYVSFVKDKASGEVILKRSQTIEEVRTLNKQLLKTRNLSAAYKSGEGFTAHVQEKYRNEQ